MPGGRAVLEPVAAGAVDGQDAADGGCVAVSRIGSENTRGGRQPHIEPLQNHARLQADGCLAHADNAMQMSGKIENQPRAQRLAGHAGSGSAGMDGDFFLGGVLHGR